MRPALRFALPLVLVASACHDKDPVRTADLPRCEGALTITTSADPAPVLRWTPACRASYVEVREAIDPADVAWSIYSPEAMIAPGIRYGVAPAGTQVLTTARPLGTDTSYLAGVGHRIASDFSVSTEVTQYGITSCASRRSGTCVTTPEQFATTTSEGVRVEAVATPATAARGDTVRITFRFVNPTAQPVTVALHDACWSTRYEIRRPQGALGQVMGCEETPFTIDVPANTTIERGRLFFDGYLLVQSGQYLCERPGEYTALMWVNAAVGGRRVRSTPATWTLVEKQSARARCAGDV